ncbi:hypothetical protein [Paracoccus sp. T5]|uniref:hypothetical protein n=1 Tax=Paracoccus sp. T5 TaxID=3402161 RepID=UPI003AEC0C1E
MRPQDPHPDQTDADRTSQTRFGPRPVPEGHHPASQSAHRKMVSSRIPPSGHVSPDGRRAWPTPTLTSKAIVWGGVALGIAGLTAATAIAARKLVGADEPERAPRRRGPAPVAPRFAELDESEREAMRRRVREQAREDSQTKALLRVEASRSRPRRGNFAQDLTKTANELSEGLNGVAQSLTTAFNAFRGVSQQANAIVGDFVTAADQLRAVIGGGSDGPATPPAKPAPGNPETPQDRIRTHRL